MGLRLAVAALIAFAGYDFDPGLNRQSTQVPAADFPHVLSTIAVTPNAAEVAESPDLPSAQAPQTEITVYATSTGTKYHRAGCRHLSRSQIPMSLRDATTRYGPCSVCKPPVLGEQTVPSQRLGPVQTATAVTSPQQPAQPDTVFVVTGHGFSGLYHRQGCRVLAQGGGLVSISRTEAEARHFRPHSDCMSPPQQAAPTAVPLQPGETIVYLPEGGTIYHRKDCLTLGRATPTPRKLSDLGPGYDPCPTCRPPTRASTASQQPSATAAPVVSPPASTPVTPATSPGRCQAITKKGTQCSRNAQPGRAYCWQH